MQVTNNSGANGYQTVANTTTPTAAATTAATTTQTAAPASSSTEQDTVTISPEAKALLGSGIAQAQGGDLPDWPPIIER